MTTINNIADLARILREQPEWAEAIRSLLLSRELLELPERFAELAERVTALTEAMNHNFELVNKRLDNLESDVRTLKSDVVELKSDVGTLKSDVGTLKSDVGTLKSDVGTLKSDVGTLKSDMVEVKNRTSNLETSVNRIHGRLDNGFGMNYQFKVEKNLGSIASQHMNVRRVRILSGMQSGRTQEFVDTIEDAEDLGLITRGQSEDIQRLDLVFRGQRRGEDTPTLIAAEISITIGDSDIMRAVERSAYLGMAFQAQVLPAVVGSRIDEERAKLAETHGVSVLITPDD
jgi:outer membrane murein-binding lipoprotein Lpp